MTRNIRYVFYLIVFSLVVVSFALHSYILMGVLLVTSIVLGMITDIQDNRRDEPFKHQNEKDFNYKH